MRAVSTKPCGVSGCDRPFYAKGMCKLHWGRNHRTGSPKADVPPMVRRAVCEVEGCGRKHATNGYCNLHAMRIRKHGSTELPPAPPPPLRAQTSGWKGDAVTYKPAHFRVVRERGSASTHLCVNCGSQAQDWAYDHADAAPLTCPKSGCTYSASPEHYVSLCRPCHKRIDNAARRGDLEFVLAVTRP